MLRPPARILGIDFSGAADAGRRTWIASARLSLDEPPAAEAARKLRTGSGGTRVRLRVESLCRAAELPGAGPGRDESLPAMRALLLKQGPCAVGYDFPAGLPRPFVRDGPDWLAFLRGFARRYPTAEALRRLCRQAAAGRELRRRTDAEVRTPFSPYNLRLFRQTYHGLRDVLAPLVLLHGASALPMQPPRPGGLWLLETCPAALLKRERLYRPYKGHGPRRRAMRGTILRTIERRMGLTIASRRLRTLALRDAGGDALDSVLAALAAARAVVDPGRLLPDGEDYRIEGYVYC